MTSLLLPVLLSLPAAASAASDPPHGGDLARLQGRWTAKAGPKRDLQVNLEIEGQQAKVAIATPQGLKFQVQGEFRIDEAVVPHALDWVHFTGLDEQDLPDIPAIYELDGETLKVCNGGPNGARPTEFKPGDGILAQVVVFERPRAKEASSSRPAPSSPHVATRRARPRDSTHIVNRRGRAERAKDSPRDWLSYKIGRFC